MIIFLRFFFAVVLLSMLFVTSWAGSQVSLWAIPREVGAHPWFIATLADAYWGFFIFYTWVWYKEPSWAGRALWFVAVVLLGNIAMAVYGLAITLRVPRHAVATAVLLRGRPVSLFLPLGLIAGLGLVSTLTALS